MGGGGGVFVCLDDLHMSMYIYKQPTSAPMHKYAHCIPQGTSVYHVMYTGSGGITGTLLRPHMNMATGQIDQGEPI